MRIDWDGEQAKDYVFVGDVARANLIALEHGDGQEFLIGTGRPTSVNEIYRVLTSLIGQEVPVERSQKRPGDVHLAYFDISRTERELGWRPSVDLAEGMRATVEFFRRQAAAAEQAQN